VFVEVADAFANSPLPDSASIVKEYVEYEGMAKEDAIEAVHEDLEAYREELTNRSNGAKELAVPQCATGIKAAAHYGIENQWTAKLFELLKSLDENNETLNTKIEKFDPSTLFSDPAYFKTKARLEQIAKSEVMTPEEQINTYREIIKDAKAENEKLKAELADLKKQLYAGSASTTSSTMGDSSMDSADDSAAEPEAAQAPAPIPVLSQGCCPQFSPADHPHRGFPRSHSDHPAKRQLYWQAPEPLLPYPAPLR
jgi:DNA repair exonuclease SbcCD ATPase subunit